MFTLPKHFAGEIIAHALRDDPLEACGLLAGQEGRLVRVFPAQNAAQSPFRYVIDSKELLRLFTEIEWGDNDWKVIGNYHSHTHSEAYPSPTDVNEAHLGPDAVYLIVSLKDPDNPLIRAFNIDETSRTVAEVPLDIVE